MISSDEHECKNCTEVYATCTTGTGAHECDNTQIPQGHEDLDDLTTNKHTGHITRILSRLRSQLQASVGTFKQMRRCLKVLEATAPIA